MRRWKSALLPAVVFLFFTALFAAGRVAAQDLENAQLLHPPSDSWPQYHGDYSGRRHVHLTQITPQNVGDLALAWAFSNRAGR
jgi:alcohol dehydrogenase (cytochrome c)